MRPEDFANLPRHAGTGTPVIKIMCDPAAEDGAGVDRAFLSLVDRGANGRTFTVVKAAGSPDDGDPAIKPSTDEALPGQPVPWWRTLFGGFLGGSLTAKDAAAPTNFDAAVAMPKLRDNLWTLQDGLREVIRNVIADDNVADKLGAIAVACDRFKAHVVAAVSEALLAPGATTVAKSVAQQVHAHLEGPAGVAWKASASIPADRSAIVAIDATVQRAQQALADLTPLLAGLAAKADPTAHPTEDTTTMTREQLALIVALAGDNAVTAAKAAGITDPVQLEQRRATAGALAAKVAITGPGNPQPGIPTDELARQMGMAPFTNGSADFQAMVAGAVQAAMGGYVAKIDAALADVAEIKAQIVGKGEGDKREPGLADVVKAQGDALDRVGQAVAKMRGTPRAPASSADPAGGNPRGPAAKADEDDDAELFSGTALAFRGKANG